MSYENPIRQPVILPAHNFTSPVTRLVKPPKSCNRGRVEYIHVSVTTTFTQNTTPGFVRVGIAADDDLYAELNMGSAAGGVAYNDTDVANTIKKDIDLTRDNVSAIQVKTVAPTGGTPAGAGDVTIGLAWF